MTAPSLRHLTLLTLLTLPACQSGPECRDNCVIAMGDNIQDRGRQTSEALNPEATTGDLEGLPGLGLSRR